MQQSVSLYLILYKQRTLFVSVLVWDTPHHTPFLKHTHTLKLISLNLHIGCRCAPCALSILSSGLKELPVSEMYSSLGTGKREHLAKPQMALPASSRSQPYVTSAYSSLAKRSYLAKHDVSGAGKQTPPAERDFRSHSNKQRYIKPLEGRETQGVEVRNTTYHHGLLYVLEL